MKFGEMKEFNIDTNKRYITKGSLSTCEYTKYNGLLYVVGVGYSKHSMLKVSEIDFEEVVKYVGVKKALLHMDSGGITECVWNGIKYRIENNNLINLEISKYEVFNLQILNSEWILL